MVLYKKPKCSLTTTNIHSHLQKAMWAQCSAQGHNGRLARSGIGTADPSVSEQPTPPSEPQPLNSRSADEHVHQFTIIYLLCRKLEKEPVYLSIQSAAMCGQKDTHTHTFSCRILTSCCLHFGTTAKLKRHFLLRLLTQLPFVQLPAPEIRNL